jgi:transcriptional regulator with XRE-family HTH domain
MYQGLNKDVRRQLNNVCWLVVKGNTAKMAMELTLRRKDLGLTQKELGEKLGVDRNTIARWENKAAKFPPVLVDFALEALENNHKKEIRKLNRVSKDVNGETGETTEPEYDASLLNWVESRSVDTTESDNKNSFYSAVTKTAITEKVVNLPELPDGDKWLKTAEIAERLGIKAHSTIRDFYNKQGLAHTRLGMVSYVKESDLNAFLANRKTRGKSEP